MDLPEVHLLIRWAHALDPRLGRKDDEEMAITVAAWHAELPTGLTLDAARRIVHDLHRAGFLPTAGAIGRRWDQHVTPLHQQGITTTARPALPHTRARPPAVEPAAVEPGPRRPPGHLAVACPWCTAAPLQPCTTPTGRLLPAGHPSRTAAAAGADMTGTQPRTEHAPRPPAPEQEEQR